MVLNYKVASDPVWPETRRKRAASSDTQRLMDTFKEQRFTVLSPLTWVTVRKQPFNVSLLVDHLLRVYDIRGSD